MTSAAAVPSEASRDERKGTRTGIVISVRPGEPDKLGRSATAGADDVDERAVDVELQVARARRGHEVLEAHQVLAGGCCLGDGEVELRCERW